MSTILVVGATGMLGSEVCRQLRAAGKSVRGLVRASSDPVKVDRLKSLGVETFLGDLREHASLDEACKGVEGVICTAASMPFSYQPGVNDIQTTDLDGITNLIEAAKANDVSRFIYTSIPETGDLVFPLQDAKRAIERKLKESGLQYTILRPSYFMEVWLSPAVGFDAANAKAALFGTGENPVSWIAVQDVAQFAVAGLDHPAARNAVLELGGPQAVSPVEVVRLFEKAGGHSFEVQFVPEEALQAQQAGATDPMQQSFSGLTRFLARGHCVEMSDTLQAFTFQLTKLEDYAGRALAPA